MDSRIKITFSVVFVHIGNVTVSAVSTKSRFATTTIVTFPPKKSATNLQQGPFFGAQASGSHVKPAMSKDLSPVWSQRPLFCQRCEPVEIVVMYQIASRAHLFYTPLARISFEDLNALDRSRRRGHIWRGREDLQRWSTPSIDRQTLQPWGTRGDTLACRSKEIKFGWWKNQSCQDWMLSSSTDLCALPGSILSSYPSLSHE